MKRLWITLLAWCAALMLVCPLFSRDVYSYFAQGQAPVQDIDPYTMACGERRRGSAPVPTRWESPAPYGPLFLLLERGVAAPTTIRCWAPTFRIIAVLGVLLLAWSVPKLSSVHGIRRPGVLGGGAGTTGLHAHFIIGVHNDASDDRPDAAGLCWRAGTASGPGCDGGRLGRGSETDRVVRPALPGDHLGGPTATFGNRSRSGSSRCSSPSSPS